MVTKCTERIGRRLPRWWGYECLLSLDSHTYGCPSSYPRAEVFFEAFPKRFAAARCVKSRISLSIRRLDASVVFPIRAQRKSWNPESRAKRVSQLRHQNRTLLLHWKIRRLLLALTMEITRMQCLRPLWALGRRSGAISRCGVRLPFSRIRPLFRFWVIQNTNYYSCLHGMPSDGGSWLGLLILFCVVLMWRRYVRGGSET